MADTVPTQLRRSPLDSLHRAANARMIAFAGWHMPLEYSGIGPEHLAVRRRAGLFDVSHMGEIEIAGKDALAAVQRVSCNDASVLRAGQAHYSGLLTPDGTFLDDVLVYRLAPAHFLLVVNAANTAKDYAWIAEQIRSIGDAAIVDSSSRYALIAIQGPAAREALQPLTGIDLGELKNYWFAHGEVASARAMVSRTGYTGEDGFEIFVAPNMASAVWQALLDSGKSADIVPCGLGARDTLRLEAAMRLYGNDIDESTTVLEADLGWMVGWSKTGFLGHETLAKQRDQGISRKLVGFELLDAGIARHGYPVLAGRTRHVGVVTSGTRTPFLKRSIGLAYVPTELTEAGTEVGIDIRGRESKARIVPLPFYRRTRNPEEMRAHTR